MIIRWNPDPILFAIGILKIRWYGLAFLIGFSLSYRIMGYFCENESRPFRSIENLLYYVVAGTIIGARLGHCFFYEPQYFLANPLEIFAIWNGGLASHGGGIGVLLSIYLFSNRHSEFSVSWILDRVSICTVLTGAFIRLGNLMNSEIIGRATRADWGFVFERVDRIPRHPTQIYESAAYFTIFLIGLSIYRYYRNNPPRLLIFGTTLSLIFLARFILEFFKENQEPFEAGMMINMGQILSLPFFIFGCIVALLAIKRQRAKTTHQ